MEIRSRTQVNTGRFGEQSILANPGGAASSQNSFLTTLQELNNAKVEKLTTKVDLQALKSKESHKTGKLPSLVSIEVRKRMFDTDKEGEQNNALIETGKKEGVDVKTATQYVNHVY